MFAPIGTKPQNSQKYSPLTVLTIWYTIVLVECIVL